MKKPMNQIGIDLVDMQTLAYNNYKYLLTAIDLYSKKAWVEPLKNKEASTVVEGMDNILKRMKDTPRSIRSDRGSEFIDKKFGELL